MKKYLIACILLTSSYIMGKTEWTSQTALFPRPLYHNLAAIMGGWDVLIDDKNNGGCAAVQAIPMYQTSYGDDRPLRSYFLLNCKPCITIGAGNSTPSNPHDVRAEWLGITDDPFAGKLTILPEQRQAGVVLEFNQDLKAWTDWEPLQTWWVDLMIPIVGVKNKLNTYCMSTSAAETAANDRVLAALCRNDLKFARLTNLERTKVGIGEIRGLVGGTYANKNGFYLAYYTGGSIPTESKPDPNYLFEPMLGSRAHFQFQVGFDCKMPILDLDEHCSAELFIRLEDHYYIPDHQWRTFDLCGKQWSRYMLLRKENDTNTIPAANVLTCYVKVSPHSYVELSTGIEFDVCDCWFFEAGYDLWAHSSEQIELRRVGCFCDKTTWSFEQYGIAGTGTASASQSTIAVQAANDLDDDGNPVFVTIKQTDIDVESGASRGGMTQKLHTALYHRYQGSKSSVLLGLGGFWEQPRTNMMYKAWGVWFKAATEF